MNSFEKYTLLFIMGISVLVIALFQLISCQRESALDQNTIAIIGNEKISLEAFRNSYEVDPSFPGYLNGNAGLREYLDFMIDKNLSDKLASRIGLIDNGFLKKQINYENKRAIIQAFYQQEVSDKVQVRDVELRDAFRKMGVRLHVKHLFAPDEASAQRIYNLLKQGVPFDTLSKQIFHEVDPQKGGADLGEVSWGDLDIFLENVVFQLKPGEYSEPVRSKWGYHILMVVDRTENIMLSESEFQAKRSQIFKVIKKRKEEIAAGEYLKTYLDPFQIKVKKEAFRKVIRGLEFKDEQKKRLQFQRIVPIKDDQVGKLKIALDNDLNLPFITSNKKMWTIGDFIEKLENLPFDKRPQISSVTRFKDDLGIMIRNEFILEEANRKGLHHPEKIDSTVRHYRQELIYHYFLEQIYRNFHLSADVENYYLQSRGKGNIAIKLPAEILPGMSSPEAYKIYYSKKELHRKLVSEFSEIRIRVNDELVQTETEKINWDHTLRMFAVPYPN